LFVPITPLGPRLIHPAAYVRSQGTRPPSLGITKAVSSNGTPGSGTRDDPSVLDDELVADDLDALDPFLAHDPKRRDAEPQDDAARPPGERSGRVVPQELDVAPRALPVCLELGLARRVEDELMRIDDDIRPVQLAQFLQLGWRERSLHRPAPAEHHDLLDARADDRVDRVVGGVRRRELLRGQRQHPDAVDRDVAVPDHDDARVREVELELLEVGMAVVPGDECGGRPGTGQILARDAEPAIGLGADRVDDRVVQAKELVVRDVPADLDVAEESKSGSRRRLLERPRDRLDVLVVGRDAESDEAMRRGQPIDHIHLDPRVVALQEGVGGVEASRAGADDGDTQRRTRDWRGTRG
jgi:hypothetical protein